MTIYNQNIDVLSYRPDNSGFFRLAVSLPSGNTKHKVVVSGQDLGEQFIALDDVIICNDIFISADPNYLTVEENGSINAEQFNIYFETEGFTPTGIYATFGILKGDKTFFSLLHKENEITDFKRSINGNKNMFSFSFPQNGKTISDLAITENMFSGTYPLLVILKMDQGDNYIVSNQQQLSSETLANNFSYPIKVINSSDLFPVVKNILGDEDTPGLINFEMDIVKKSSYGLPGKSGFTISSLSSFNENTQTILQFSGYKSSFDDFLNDENFDHQYIPNTEFNILKSGVVYVPEIDERFIIEKSSNTNSPSGNTTVIIDDNVVSKLKGKDIIVTDFLPTHFRIKSDTQGVSKTEKLEIKEYDSGSIRYKTIYATGSIVDNSNLYIELIDDYIDFSILKKIDIDRNDVLTSTTSDVSDKYFVSSIFYNKYDSDREIFWSPIIPANDGSLGITSNNDVVYLKLESTRPIANIEGYVQVGDNLVNLSLSIDEESGVTPPSNQIGGKVLNINGQPIKNAEILFQISLSENIDLPSLKTISKEDGSWGQRGFIDGQKYIAKITNNSELYGSSFSPSEHVVTITSTPQTGLNFILEGEFTNSSNSTGNSSNNVENNNNAFILKSDNTVSYIKLDFSTILGSSIPEQNLRILSDIKVFDEQGNTFSVRI